MNVKLLDLSNYLFILDINKHKQLIKQSLYLSKGYFFPNYEIILNNKGRDTMKQHKEIAREIDFEFIKYRRQALKVNLKKECEKYADISCKYGFKIGKDKVLTNNYDDILFAGYYIIDKDHNVYYYKKP